MHQGTREQLAQRLRELEREMAQVERELLGLGAGEALPGVYLVVEVCGLQAAVPAARVTEIVRLVACAPIANAPPWAVGTFSYRGQPLVAADLGAFLRGPRQPPLDAHMLVLRGSRPLAVVVDRVRTLAEAPRHAPCAGELIGAWAGSPLVAGVCRVGEELLPLLGFEALVAAAGEEPAA